MWYIFYIKFILYRIYIIYYIICIIYYIIIYCDILYNNFIWYYILYKESTRVGHDWAIELTDVSIPRERDSEELCRFTTEVENLHNLLSVSWMPRKGTSVSPVWDWRPENWGSQWYESQFKGRRLMRQLKHAGRKQKGQTVFLRFLFQALSDLMMIRHREKGNVRHLWVHPRRCRWPPEAPSQSYPETI